MPFHSARTARNAPLVRCRKFFCRIFCHDANSSRHLIRTSTSVTTNQWVGVVAFPVLCVPFVRRFSLLSHTAAPVILLRHQHGRKVTRRWRKASGGCQHSALEKQKQPSSFAHSPTTITTMLIARNAHIFATVVCTMSYPLPHTFLPRFR